MRSVVVIGLSSFGHYLCKYLTENDVEVLAVDNDENKIERVKEFVKNVVLADARDKNILMQLGLKDADAVIVSVGDQIDTSILITFYLHELNVKEIITKAITEDHAKILHLIGATTIIFPERDIAKKVAHTLRRGNLLDYIPLGGDYSVVEMAPPSKWLGKKLSQINMRQQYNVQVIMIKEILPMNTILIPSADHVLKDSDILVLMGKEEDLEKIEKA